MFGIGDKEDDYVRILGYAVMIAIVAGIITAAVIVYYSGTESYTALHLENYSNYIENGVVSFTYGVDRFGPYGEDYLIRAVHRGNVMYTDTFRLEGGQDLMKKVSFRLNETEFPVKLQLILREGSGEVYEVYFWLKGNA